jgi:predicted HTH transcriptional regulator
MRIFKDIRLVEQLGSGIPRILNFYSKDCFKFTAHFIRMKFMSLLKSEVTTPQVTPHVTPHDGLVDGLVNGLVDGLVENQKKMIRLIKNKPTITIQELSQSIGISATAIDKNLMKLKEKKIIRRVGNNKNGGWVIVS